MLLTSSIVVCRPPFVDDVLTAAQLRVISSESAKHLDRIFPATLPADEHLCDAPQIDLNAPTSDCPWRHRPAWTERAAHRSSAEDGQVRAPADVHAVIQYVQALAGLASIACSGHLLLYHGYCRHRMYLRNVPRRNHTLTILLAFS